MGSRLRRALQRVFRVVGPRARPRCRLADDRAGGGRPRRARASPRRAPNPPIRDAGRL